MSRDCHFWGVTLTTLPASGAMLAKLPQLRGVGGGGVWISCVSPQQRDVNQFRRRLSGWWFGAADASGATASAALGSPSSICLHRRSASYAVRLAVSRASGRLPCVFPPDSASLQQPEFSRGVSQHPVGRRKSSRGAPWGSARLRLFAVPNLCLPRQLLPFLLA